MFEAANPSINALAALEQLKFDEQDEAAFNEGLTLGKIAFALPVIEHVLRDKKIDSQLCREAITFLKAAFSQDFLTVEERDWPPLLLLNKCLLETLCDPDRADHFEDIFELLKLILRRLNAENAESKSVGIFLKAMVDQLRHPNEYVREHVGRLLLECTNIIEYCCIQKQDFATLTRLLVSSKEGAGSRRATAQISICEQLNVQEQPEMHDHLIDELEYSEESWQLNAAKALSTQFSADTIAKLREKYENFQIRPATFDRVGRVLVAANDMWKERRGVAIQLRHYISSPHYSVEFFEPLLHFLVPNGINDRNAMVRKIMFETASLIIKLSGAEKIDFVRSLLEDLLKAVPDNADGDTLRNGLICLLGTLAQHLEAGSSKLDSIFGRLIDALSIPSRQIQESVAACLPPLTPMLEEKATEEVCRMMQQLPMTPNYGLRWGYAYGIAGITRGLGLRSHEQIRLLALLADWLDSKNKQHREAGCILFATMCVIHRRAFEPFIYKLLPAIIATNGDTNNNVRDEGRNAGAAMMISLSPTGVRMFLPIVLASLDSTSWRAKCAAADFLANFSNCAPAQLSESLPRVVPALATLVTDSHIKVRDAGIAALKQIATVITNPEILAISSHLINAFIEPAKETTRALRIIVNTRFVHYVDASSLALIMPILKRALNDREPEGRRMAANVVTNVFTIVDEKDIVPYCEMLVPALKHSLLDPDPKTRSAAAQAIGSIVQHNKSGMFTSYTTSLIPWLKERMMSRSSMVDRLGAAQGMAEVIAAFETGTDVVIQQAIAFTLDTSNDAALRDGYIRLFTYLPSTLGERFIPFIEAVVPALLLSLSDETEYLRHSALQTGQILISTYCAQAKQHLLPSLLEGVLNEQWRQRHAAVTLIGEFLFNISGISGKMTSETATEDDTLGLAAVNQTIVRYVGQKTRDEIITALYIARFDAGVHVRQAASHVWKLVVANTPRTVKDALPMLFALIVHCMATSTEDRLQMGQECLGEIVRKLGERIMEPLMPEVQKSLENERIEYRRGAMRALSVIIVNAQSEVFVEYDKFLIKAFRRTLCDPDLALRQAAGETFAVYHNKVGIGALETIADPLFNEYAKDESEQTLDGIMAILSVNRRGRLITIPSLVARILKFKSKTYVLSRLSDVISDTIERSFLHIFQTLLAEQPEETTAAEEYFGHCATLLHCLRSTYTIVGAFKFFASRGDKGDLMAAKLMSQLVRIVGVREELLATFVDGCMLLYCSESKAVTDEAAKLLSAMIAQCNTNEAMEISVYISAYAVGVREERRILHGLNDPTHWRPFSELMSISSRAGSLAQREKTLRAVADLLEMTQASVALRPVAPSIVAILLRLLADQCPPTLKLQAVRCVNSLVQKVPDGMRPFVPQLTAFMNRLTLEHADSAAPDVNALLSLTESTLEKVQLLLPNRAA